jgi:glycosyltransferase involved in cell wall biosynthesis
MKTRVAIVTPEGLDGRGGIGRIMTYLTRQLASDAGDIEIRVQRTRYSERPVLKHLTVPFALAAFVYRCLDGSIDVAHINVAPRGSTWRKRLFLYAAKWCGKPVVLHLHGSGYDQFHAGLSPRRQQAVRAMFQEAAMVVALSDYWETFLRSTFALPSGRISKIPNGVPTVAPNVPSDAGRDPTILFLGLVGERKGVDVLLEALAQLAGEGLHPRLVIGGNGEVEAFAALAGRLGLAGQVEFLGWIGEDSVDACLRAADIFVLPSRAENQPVAILEAMARAVPVISSHVGAIPEQVMHGQTGLLVPPGDAAALAQAIRTLVSSPETRRAFGLAGRQRFLDNFSIASCSARFAALYRSLAGRAPDAHG